MHTDTTQLGILAFILAVLAGGAGAAAIAAALILRKYDFARLVALAAALAAGGYGTLLLLAAFTTGETTLGRGEEKHFCEVDCHVAYSVVDVRQTLTLGTATTVRQARGTFYVVTLRVRFDERTTSARRPQDMPLWPNPRWTSVRDADGHDYRPSLDGLAAFEAANGTVKGLDRALRPGESYTTTLVFDLPDQVREPRLLLTSPLPENAFVVSNENSFFHKKVVFRL
jgi:hypothetical protein